MKGVEKVARQIRQSLVATAEEAASALQVGRPHGVSLGNHRRIRGSGLLLGASAAAH